MKNPFLFLLIRIAAGRLREIRKHPQQIVFLIFIILLLGLILVSSIMDKENQGGWVDIPVRNSIITLLCLILAYFSIKRGLEKGSSFYRMADVNLIFSSPLSHRSILIFGFAKQLGISLLVMIWLIFQTANLKGLFAVNGIGYLYFYLGVFFSILYMPVLSMLLYSSILKNHKMKTLWVRGFLLLAGIAILAFAVVLIKTGDLFTVIYLFFNHPVVKFVPLVGWIWTLLTSSYLGWTLYSWVSLGLTIVGLTYCVRRLLKSDLDFYEDVLVSTERREEQIQSKQKGQVNYDTKGRIRRAGSFYRGWGSSAIFFRQLLEYRKSGFLLFDRFTIFVSLAGLVSGYLLRTNPLAMFYMFYITLYVLFFVSIFCKWNQELQKPYIYLIPASPMVKIWWATASAHLKNLIDGLLLFGIAGQILSLPLLTRLFLAFCYVSFGGIYIYVGILFDRWFGFLSEIILGRMVAFLLIMLFATPAVAVIIIASIKYPGNQLVILGSLGSVVLYGVLIAFFGMWVGRGLLTSTENNRV